MLPSGGRGGYELDPSLQLHPLARQRIAQAGLPVDLIGLSAEVSAPDASVQRWQDRLQPVWGALAGGCHLGRDIPALLTSAGFTLMTSQTRYQDLARSRSTIGVKRSMARLAVHGWVEPPQANGGVNLWSMETAGY